MRRSCSWPTRSMASWSKSMTNGGKCSRGSLYCKERISWFFHWGTNCVPYCLLSRSCLYLPGKMVLPVLAPSRTVQKLDIAIKVSYEKQWSGQHGSYIHARRVVVGCE